MAIAGQMAKSPYAMQCSRSRYIFENNNKIRVYFVLEKINKIGYNVWIDKLIIDVKQAGVIVYQENTNVNKIFYGVCQKNGM
jgi:hypothetical protein